MKWARGPRASSVTEKMQRWLQQQRRYYRILLDEEFKASHTVSVIALVQSSATKAAVKSEQGQSLESNSERGIYWHCQNRKLKASSCQLDWGVERKTSHSPPKVSGISQASTAQVSAPGWRLPVTCLRFRKPLRAPQCSKGRSSIPTAANPPARRWYLLLELARGAGGLEMKHLTETDECWGVITPQLGVSGFGSPGMFLFTIIYNGAAHNFTPWNGALFCHVCKCKAKEGLPSKDGLNPENFPVPTVSIGYWGAVNYKNAMGWLGYAF